MHQQNLAGRDGFCIECEKALLRQKALCEQRWQNADGQSLLHKRDNGGGGTHRVVGQKRHPLFGKPCVQIAPGTGAGLHRHDGEPEYLIVRQMLSSQRFESRAGYKHVTKRGKISHGQVLHICQRRNCQHYVRLLCAEHLDRLMCGAALHLKRHIGMHLPELSQLRQQEMVQRRLRSADDQRTCFKGGQPL